MTTVELAGAPKRLVFPRICANCGSAAEGRLTIAKVFERITMRRRRNIDDPTKYSVVRVDVPFCDPCASRHRQVVVEISVVRRALSYFFSMYVVGAAICAIAVWLYFQPFVIGSGDQQFAIAPRPREAAAFAVVGGWCVFAAWFGTRRFRIPQGSEVTAAFDFERGKSYFWQRTPYKYELRNDQFGSAFTAANRR